MAGRACLPMQSPYPSRAMNVDPAGVRGRRSGLPREVYTVSPAIKETEEIARLPDHRAEVSRGHSRGKVPRRTERQEEVSRTEVT